MATKNYLSLEGLTQYDSLIKNYIGTEDAKSIKSLSVSGNTVSFFKTEDASGTAAYTVNIPDVSGFMDKIANASGGKIVTSTSAGQVAESATAISDLATNAFVGTIPSGASSTTVTAYAKEVADSKDSAITAAQSAADAAQSDVDALETLVGEIPSTADATTVVGYIDEAVADATSDSEVELTEAQTPTTGYLKTYVLSQGGSEVGKIDIPKDLVVTSGEIVVNPQGQPAGTYLKLTIANQTEPVYINVADLCDVYTAEASASQVQLAISNTNEISAEIVDGSVDTDALGTSAVTTAKIADDAVTAAKVSISAHTESQTASTDGLAISVTTTDGQVSAVSGSIAQNTYDSYGSSAAAQSAAEGYTDAEIAKLDAVADGTKTAIDGSTARTKTDNDGIFALQGVTEADGKLSAMTVVEVAQIGASNDAASKNTIYGAKAYADAATGSISSTDISALFS